MQQKRKKKEISEHKRIVGGSPATLGEFPYQVALYNLQKGTICGGSIIASNLVLTAAHCVRSLTNGDTPAGSLQVISTNDRSSDQNSDQTKTGTRVFIHSSYTSSNSFLNRRDIAVIQLSSSFNLNSNTATVRLAQDTNLEIPPRTATVTGFGTTVSNSNGNSNVANVMQKVDVPLVDDATCVAAAQANNLPGLPVATVCAGSPGKDSCSGDSGGPLVVRDSQGIINQIGVVSTGTKTTNPQDVELVV